MSLFTGGRSDSNQTNLNENFLKNMDTDNVESKIHTMVNISSNKGHSELPKFDVVGNNISVIWLDDTFGAKDLFYKRSIDGGKTFEKPINLGRNFTGIYDHQVLSADNYVYVIWEQSPDSNGQIYFQRSIDGGKTFEKPINLGNNTGLSGTPQIAISNENTKGFVIYSPKVYVTWHDASNGIIIRKSDNGGQDFEKPIKLSENNPLSFFPKITTSGNNVYMAWVTIYDKGTEKERVEVSFAKSNNGGKTFEKSFNLTTNSKISLDPQITSSKNNVFVAWTNGTIVSEGFPLLTDTIFRYSNNSGQTFQEAISLNNYTGWSIQPMIKSSGNEIFAIWTEKDQNTHADIYFCVINSTYSKGCSYKVNLSNDSEDSFNPTFDSVNKDIFVAWTQGNILQTPSIVLKKVTLNGSNYSVYDQGPALYHDNEDYFDPQVKISDTDNRLFILVNGKSTSNDEVYFLNIDIPTVDNKNIKLNIKNGKNLSNNWILYETTNHKQPDTFDDDTKSNANTLDIFKNVSIAIVEPTFTNAAYNNAFYIFYNLYLNSLYGQNITNYLNLLTTNLEKDPQPDINEYGLKNHISGLIPNANISFLSDADIHNGYVLKNSKINLDNYDILILGHQEYVTQDEYDHLKQFVANGGILILMYSNSLYAEVSYDDNADSITLVKGHNWEYNGKTAWKSIIQERWIADTSNWTGSNYANQSSGIIFGNNPFGYVKHEEQFITNPNVLIILDYNATVPYSQPGQFNDFKIATYEHDFEKGKVIGLGIYPTENLLNNSRFLTFFDSILLKYVINNQTTIE
jgi:hypothetical protein